MVAFSFVDVVLVLAAAVSRLIVGWHCVKSAVDSIGQRIGTV